MNDELLLRLWGKSDPASDNNYHPLLFHLLDVGFCARALWREGLSALARARLADALGLPKLEAEQVCTLLAAQHDLGKASAFQLKPSVSHLAAKVRAAGFDILVPANPEHPHGFVSARVLPELVQDGTGGWRADIGTIGLLAQITGGHHGTFPSQSNLNKINSANALGGPLWDEARRALLTHVQEILFPNALPVAVPKREAANVVPLLGGFVSIADWLGSSKEHFKPSADVSVAAYAVRSEAQAQKAVQQFGWTKRPRFAAPAAFGDIFHDKHGKPFDPNPMQSTVENFADSAIGPYLLIVEAAMGEGKTEAALYAIDRALTTHAADGFFLALPTQATGNALFGRILKDYLRKRGHVGPQNFQLVHAGSFLHAPFDALQQAASAPDREDEVNCVVAQQWFTQKKQALLAPFGVGTIDQSLLGVLQTRHWFVRLFGLAGKVVVFDEVHAYDVYMGTILARLLRWLRMLNCTVVLLSATLPDGKRRELMQAWDKTASVPEETYPRVTFVANGKAETVHAPQKTVAPKDVQVSYAAPDLAGLPDAVKNGLPDGGCAAVICNTVARAQEAYKLLRDALSGDGWEVTLYHARTLANWRAAREAETLAAFGKEGPRPQKAVLIATQVAEQSLDLDFDWMASDMAPADLLLQRLGRLWRHPRGSTRPVSEARFLVLCGMGEDGLPMFPDGTEYVYSRYVLLRSRLALQDRPLKLPADIDRLVQEVYASAEPEGLSAAWQDALESSLEFQQKAARDSRKAAKQALVRPPDAGAQDVLEQGEAAGDVRAELYDDDDPQVHKSLRAATREGDPSVSIVCTGTDANGSALAKPPDAIPDPKTRYPAHVEAARRALGFSVSVSNKKLFHTVVNIKPPSAWQNSPFLRYHRALHFDNGLCETVTGFRLRLSEELGLVIEQGEQN